MGSWVEGLRLQAIITGIVCASAVALAGIGNGRAAASEPNPARSRPSLGTDFAIGAKPAFEREWASIYRTALRRIRGDVRDRLRAAQIRYENLRISGGSVRFTVLDASAIERVRQDMAEASQAWGLSLTASMPGIAVQAASSGEITLSLTAFGLAALHDGVIATSTFELKRWLAGSGFDDYLLTDDGDRIRLEIRPVAGLSHAGRQC